MTIYNRGEIIIVPFPFSDQTSSKKRPAIIISSDKYNQVFQDVIIMAVTSQTGNNTDYYDAIIEDWENAGLLKPSVIKPVISTLEKQLIIKKLGKISQKDTDALHKLMQSLLY